MTITNEDKYLFTASIDGTLIIYNIKSSDQKDSIEQVEDMPIELSEDYLFGKKEFDKKLQAIAHLDKRNHELKIKNLR